MGNVSGKPVVFSDDVKLDHFRLLRVVGKGAFGKVRIVERKDTGLTFALKYIRKDEVVRSESVRNMIRERRMLEHLNHPFLCNLRYSFQDVEYLYIVVDLMTGGDLRFHITRKAFTEEAVRFWIAELGCALRYVHGQGIVHRDVKPDNVLLDAQGHVHLADFNVATDLTPGKQLTSKSGTLAYLAPEVYRQKGYGAEVDWWSLGVLFYECIYSKRPFEGNHQEQLAQAVMKGEPPYPATNPPLTMTCLHAMSSLLEKDRKQRIGSSSWNSFVENPFFQPIDFEALERKEIEPIFIPSSDKTNFDATYDLEELLLEEAPLEARTRKQKPRAGLKENASDAEIRADELHRMIETLFIPFDYTRIPEQRIPVGADDTGIATTLSDAAKGEASRNGSPSSEGGTPPVPRSMAPGNQQPGDYFETVRNGRLQAQGSDSVQMEDGMQPQTPGGARSSPVSGGRGGTGRSGTGSKRTTSVSGTGTQVIFDDPTNPTASHPIQAGLMEDGKKPHGVLGFLSRKKGRGSSPKPKERGVLGKEGSRVIVSP